MSRFFEIVNLSVSAKHFNKRAIAVGMFDGVHLGHQALIGAVTEKAKRNNFIPCAVTFREAPIKWLSPETTIQLITTLDERLLLFKQFGIEEVIIFDFPQLINLNPANYLNEILKDELNCFFIACGENHHFGKEQKGDLTMLANWAISHNIELEVVKSVKDLNGQLISSSLIRELLKQGDLKVAAEKLGHSFINCQPLREGQHKGRQLGFPTLNFDYPFDKVRMPFGVYAATTQIKGINYISAVNLGFAPTLERETTTPILESHLLEMPPDEVCPKVGEMLKVELLEFIRAEKKFSDLDELKQQISADCALIKQKLKTKAKS